MYYICKVLNTYKIVPQTLTKICQNFWHTLNKIMTNWIKFYLGFNTNLSFYLPSYFTKFRIICWTQLTLYGAYGWNGTCSNSGMSRHALYICKIKYTWQVVCVLTYSVILGFIRFHKFRYISACRWKIVGCYCCSYICMF